MRKERVYLPEFVSLGDYKIDHVEMEARRNYESREKWLYLGADARDSTFAKIELTMGDLSSRSYSSARPSYYIFCAFKCRYYLSKPELETIEEDILSELEYIYSDSDGSTARLDHYESGRPSECFSPIDFQDFFVNLHLEIFEKHRDSFVISSLDDGAGRYYGEFVDCIMNKKIANKQKYLSMIIQH